MENTNGLTHTDLTILVLRFLEDFNKELMVDSYADFVRNWRMLQHTMSEIQESNFEAAVEYRQASDVLTDIDIPHTERHNDISEFMETVEGTSQGWSLLPDALMAMVSNEREICIEQGQYLMSRGHTLSHPQLLRYFGMEFQVEKLNISLEKYRVHDNNAFNLKATRENLENFRARGDG